MGTLLKCYKPLFSTQLSSFSNSARTIRLSPLRTQPLLFKPVRCLGSSGPRPSPPSIAQNLRRKSDGETAESSLSSELWLYNTMSRKKEAFGPKAEGKVGMYVCGVTAYENVLIAKLTKVESP